MMSAVEVRSSCMWYNGVAYRRTMSRSVPGANIVRCLKLDLPARSREGDLCRCGQKLGRLSSIEIESRFLVEENLQILEFRGRNL